MKKIYSYNELNRLIGCSVILLDINGKQWTGKLEDLISESDNESDEREGELSVGLYVDGLHYEFYQSEIIDIRMFET